MVEPHRIADYQREAALAVAEHRLNDIAKAVDRMTDKLDEMERTLVRLESDVNDLKRQSIGGVWSLLTRIATGALALYAAWGLLGKLAGK